MATTLYYGEPNGPSLTVLAALAEKNVEADLVHIDLTRGERHSAQCERDVEVNMAVEGEGPVLVVDGEPMAESVFIAVYLDEVGRGPALRPSDPYARWEMMAWCRWVTERIAPAAAFLGTRAHLAGRLAAMNEGQFTAIVRNIHAQDLRERWEATRAGNFPADKVADSEVKIAQGVEKVEARLAEREWLIGEFSIADLETYAWLAGMVELVPGAFVNAPRTTAWLERVRTRPSVARALSLATVTDPRSVWAPGPEINRWG